MALQVTGNRIFLFKSEKKTAGKESEPIKLEDPNPLWSPESVMDFYANTYPELNNGTVNGPSLDKDENIVYQLTFIPKTKG